MSVGSSKLVTHALITSLGHDQEASKANFYFTSDTLKHHLTNEITYQLTVFACCSAAMQSECSGGFETISQEYQSDDPCLIQIWTNKRDPNPNSFE